MSGYNYKINKEMQPTQIEVGCKKCKTVWSEPRVLTGVKFEETLMIYDACDVCLTPEDIVKINVGIEAEALAVAPEVIDVKK